MTTLEHSIITQALIIGANLKNYTNDFREIKYRQTARMWLDLYNLWDNYDVHKFYGYNPITGSPAVVYFNEPSPGKSNIMNWNPLLKSWMFSSDAGLTWMKVDFTEEVLKKVDCLCSEPKYQ